MHVANDMISGQVLPGTLGKEFTFASTSSIDVSIFLTDTNPSDKYDRHS